MRPRLAAGVEVSALIQHILGEGGFATVLAKGDPERGSIVLVITDRGRHVAILERIPDPQGDYRWSRIGPAGTDAVFVEWLKRRRSSDPDLWVIELDTPLAERFIAETIASG